LRIAESKPAFPIRNPKSAIRNWEGGTVGQSI
jgi:hypothetical protein